MLRISESGRLIGWEGFDQCMRLLSARLAQVVGARRSGIQLLTEAPTIVLNQLVGLYWLVFEKVTTYSPSDLVIEP